MKNRVRLCIVIYICICVVYVTICLFSYFDHIELGIDLPRIHINLIKNYPDFEGANILK